MVSGRNIGPGRGQPQNNVAIAFAGPPELQEPVDKLAIERDPHLPAPASERRGLIDPGYPGLKGSKASSAIGMLIMLPAYATEDHGAKAARDLSPARQVWLDRNNPRVAFEIVWRAFLPPSPARQRPARFRSCWPGLFFLWAQAVKHSRPPSR